MLHRLLLIIAWAPLGGAVVRPEDLVNPLAGTFTDGQKFSTGNTLPLVGRPWGFNHWAPQTNKGTSSWWFSGSDHEFRWIRCTHQPSPWIGDYAWFMMGPQMGSVQHDPVGFWEPRGATIKPHLMDFVTGPDGMHIQLAPTMHGALLHVTFPTYNPSSLDKHICWKLANGDTFSDVGHKSREGKWQAKAQCKRVNGRVSGFKQHVLIQSDATPSSVHDGGGLLCLNYGKAAQGVTVRMATSFISADQAEVSLNRELPNSEDYDSVAKDSRREWNELLSRVDVQGPFDGSEEKHLTVFYTGLYRALTFPRSIAETDASGKVVHYSPYDPHGGVHPGPLVTDNGFWDTFRTVYPMLSLLYPDHLGWIIQGWLNAYREGGWLPKWASPGYRDSMVGTFADVVVADAIVKGVTGFDVDLAWSAIRKDSFQEGHSGGAVAKVGLKVYDAHKYIPSDSGVSEHVSRSLDFAFADAATARAARHIAAGSDVDTSFSSKLNSDAAHLWERALGAMKNLYDRDTGLMRPKNSRGQFENYFRENRWGGAYTEGCAWHHSFPPFAIDELSKLHGGDKELVKSLHRLLETPGTFDVGGYGSVIHEMSEARAVAMGQYAHNNQPTHHLLYLFALLGRPDETQRLVRHVMDHGYGSDFYAGDEDNGEMGAWFVLSALALYATNPGTDHYVLGSPLFQHVRITLPSQPADAFGHGPREGRVVDIVAPGTGPDYVYVEKVTWNGETVSDPFLRDGVFQQGGTLQFNMKGYTGSSLTTAAESTLSPPLLMGGSGGGGVVGGGGGAVTQTGGGGSGGGGDDSMAVQRLQQELASEKAAHEAEEQDRESAEAEAKEAVKVYEDSQKTWAKDRVEWQHALAGLASDVQELEGELQKSLKLNEATHDSFQEAQKGQQDASQLRTQMERELEALKLELSLEHAEQRRMGLLFKSQSEQLNRMEVVGDAMKQAENDGPGLLLSIQFVRRSLLLSGITAAIGIFAYMHCASDDATAPPRKSASHIV